MTLSIDNVSKRYGKRDVLRGVSLSVSSGEAVAVVGKNGCGKSTLLSIAAGALKPNGGMARLDGQDVPRLKRLSRHIGFLPQGDPLFEELTVSDNVRFWARAHGVPFRPKTDPFVNLLDLTDSLRKPVRALSGGTRRRAAICACLVADPGVLLLDEPFSGLDLYVKQQLIDYLKKLRAAGKAILYTTHGADEIAPLADSLAALSNGQIAQTMTAAEIHAQGANLIETLVSVVSGDSA